MCRKKQNNQAAEDLMNKKTFAYVGTWTVQTSENGGEIGIYEYHEIDGSLTYRKNVRPDITAGMMCVDQERGILYAVDERTDSEEFFYEGGGGRVLAFSINPETGDLTEFGEEQPTFGLLPAYLSQDGSRKWLIACNHSNRKTVTKHVRGEDGTYHVITEYSDVTAVLYPLDQKGRIGKAVQIIEFPVDWSHRPPKTACLHCVKFAPDGRHFVLTDMKQDLVLTYELDQENGRMIECDRKTWRDGNYPHYAAFHPNYPVFYLNNEHAHLLDVVHVDENWKMEIVQTIDVTPDIDFNMTEKKVMQTDVGVSADGKYVYDLYRGANSIWVFEVNEADGTLKKKQEFKFGKEGNPRGFAFSPDGKFILVANNAAHQVITLRILPDGRLEETGKADGNLRFPGNISFYRGGAYENESK